PLLFGMNFSPAIIPAMILCVANIFLNLNLSLHEIIRGAGLPSLGIKPEYAGLAVNIVLLLLLLWKWGGVGAAIASLVSYATTYFSLLYVFSRQANIPGSLYSLPQKKDFALLLQNIRVQLALFKS
ncbi:MAG TPA: polysaccharide biosynthesis C-terminal domain-containing protein, partial [Geobacteraceae bacterium]